MKNVDQFDEIFKSRLLYHLEGAFLQIPKKKLEQKAECVVFFDYGFGSIQDRDGGLLAYFKNIDEFIAISTGNWSKRREIIISGKIEKNEKVDQSDEIFKSKLFDYLEDTLGYLDDALAHDSRKLICFCSFFSDGRGMIQMRLMTQVRDETLVTFKNIDEFIEIAKREERLQQIVKLANQKESQRKERFSRKDKEIEYIKQALYNLTNREERVLKMRFGIDYQTTYTLEAIARYFKLSREGVRQIEKRALKKLENTMKNRKSLKFLMKLRKPKKFQKRFLKK